MKEQTDVTFIIKTNINGSVDYTEVESFSFDIKDNGFVLFTNAKNETIDVFRSETIMSIRLKKAD